MKKAIFILSAFFLLLTVMPSQGVAQDTNTRKAKRMVKKARKDQKKKVKAKAIKAARVQAKEYVKYEGWKVFPGDKPMAKMLEESWMKQ